MNYKEERNRIFKFKVLIILIFQIVSYITFAQTNTYIKSFEQKNDSIFLSQIIDKYENTKDTMVLISFTVNKAGEVYTTEVIKTFCNSCDSSGLLKVNELIKKSLEDIKMSKWMPNKSEQKFYVPIRIKDSPLST